MDGAGAEGLPFDWVVNATWGQHNLTTVRWGWPEQQLINIELDAAGVVRTSRDNETLASVVEDALRAFFGHVSWANASDRDAAVQAILASEAQGQDAQKYIHGRIRELNVIAYSGATAAPLRLGALYGDLDEDGSLIIQRAGAAGRTEVSAGRWEFDFSTPTRTLAATDLSYKLSVDARGTVAFEGLRAGERPEESYRKDMFELLDKLGLPKPSEDQVGVSGSIC